MASVDLPETLRRIQQVKLLPLFLALALCRAVRASCYFKLFSFA